MLMRFRPRWPVWMAFALLAGCGEATHGPADDMTSEVASTQPVLETPSAAVPEAEEISLQASVPRSVVNEDEDAGEDVDTSGSLETRVEALLASGKRIARRALRLLLAAREAGEDVDTPVAELAERAARTLIDWDTLALSHDATGLSERDLPLLQRWNADDARVQALAVELERVQRLVAALVQADRRIAAGHLVDASGDHAIAHLHTALRIAPQHAGTLRRLEAIETSLLGQALAAGSSAPMRCWPMPAGCVPVPNRHPRRACRTPPHVWWKCANAMSSVGVHASSMPWPRAM